MLPRVGRSRFSRRQFSVFLDQDGIRASGTLWSNIKTNLEKAKYLLLIASPEAQHSHWVNEEVKWWIANRRLDRLIVVLARKAPNSNSISYAEVVPPALQEIYIRDEPFLIDFSFDVSAADFSSKAFRGKLVTLAGTVQDLSASEIQDLNNTSEKVYRRDKKLVTAATITGLALVLSIIGFLIERKQQQEMTNLEESAKFASEAIRQIAISPHTSITSAIKALSISDNDVSREAVRQTMARALPAERIDLGLRVKRLLIDESKSTKNGIIFHENGWQKIKFNKQSSNWRLVGDKYRTDYPIAMTFPVQGDVVAVTYYEENSVSLLNFPYFGQKESFRMGNDGCPSPFLGVASDLSKLAIPESGSKVKLINLLSPTFSSVEIETAIPRVCWGAFSNDGKKLVVAGIGGKQIQLIDVADHNVIESLPKFNSPVLMTIKWSPDSSTLFGGDIEGTLHIWKFLGDTVIKQERQVGNGLITDIIFTRDETRLIVSTGDIKGTGGSLSVVDITDINYQVIQKLQTDGGMLSLFWMANTPIDKGNPEGATTLASVIGGQLYLWNFALNKIDRSFPVLIDVIPLNSPKLIDNGDKLYIVAENGRIMSMDTKEGNLIKEIYKQRNEIRGAGIYGTRLYWVGRSPKLHSRELNSDEEVEHQRLTRRSYNSLSIDAKSHRIYAVANVGSIDVMNLNMSNLVETIDAPAGDHFTFSTILNDTGETLIGTKFGTVYQYHDEELVKVGGLPGKGAVIDIKSTNNARNQLIAILYDDSESSSGAPTLVFVENFSSPEIIKELELDAVSEMAIDSYGKWLSIGGSFEGKGRLIQFSLENLDDLPIIGESRDNFISSVLYNSDDQLITSGINGVIENWGSHAIDLKNFACHRLETLTNCSTIKYSDIEIYELCDICMQD